MLLFAFLLLINLNASAEVTLKNIPCFDQVARTISEAGSPKKWLSLPQGVGSRIENFGRVEVLTQKDTTKLVLVGKTHTKTFVMYAPQCEVKVQKPFPNKNNFSDFDLAELFQENKEGLVLIWSPHMDLSIKEVTDLPKYDLKKSVTVIMDPNADEKLAKKIQEKNQWPESYLRKLDSSILEKADITIHYPSVVFYKDSKILKRIPGFNGVALKKVTKEFLP